MKNTIVNTVIVLITLVVFSSAAQAQSAEASNGGGAAASNASVENSASNGGVSNSQGNVTINFEAEEDTRGIEAPIQTENSSSVHYSGEYDVNTVPDVSAPGLTTTLTETCMGSTSAGGAVVGFGFSFGTTWRDSACVRRLDSRQMMALGYNLGAKELMCDSPKVRSAMKRAGKPCFADLPEAVREEINPSANADVIVQEKNVSARAEYTSTK